MAIIFTVQAPGQYIAYGLSTDTKPPSPPTNCLFIEIDSGNRFIVVGGEWTAAPGAGVPDLATTQLVPTSSKTIADNTACVTYGFYEITGDLNLTINGNGKFCIQ